MAKENEARKPKDYKDPKPMWNHLGFKESAIEFAYTWPTIQKDGSVKDENYVMKFWIKELN